MYERFVRWATRKVPRLPRDATPQDRARAVAQVMDQGTASSSWEITGLMEVAEYSLHRITTDDYAAMYLTSNSLGVAVQWKARSDIVSSGAIVITGLSRPCAHSIGSASLQGRGEVGYGPSRYIVLCSFIAPRIVYSTGAV